MAQFVRPIADIVTDVWTTTPLWSKIDDAVGTGDADVVLSDTSPVAAEAFVVDGGTVTDPAVSTGHILRMRGAKVSASGANYDITCELRQGYVSEVSQGTLIATAALIAKANATLETAAHTLTAGEADTITDYSDLQFRCFAVKNGGGANEQVQIADVELEVPDASNDLSVNEGDNVAVADTGDAVRAHVLIMPDVEDTLTITEDQTINVILMPGVSDDVSVAELLPPPVELFVPITVTDFANVNVIISPQIFESDVTLEEFQALNVILGPSVEDTLVVTEDVTTHMLVFPDTFEDVAVAEDQTVNVILMPNVFEDEITVSEFVDVTGAEAAAGLTIDEGDTVTVSEDQTLNVILMPDVEDTITVTESQAVNVILGPSVFDTVGVAEDQTLNVILAPSVSDTVAVTEDQALNVVLMPSVFDELTVTEDTPVNVILMPDVFDTATVTEGVTAKLAQHKIDENDTVTVADFRLVLVGEPEPPIEINVFDIVWLFSHFPGGTDTITVTEFVDVNVSADIDIYPAVFENVSVAEFIDVLFDTLVIDVSDTVTAADFANLFETRLTPVVFDTVNIVEARTLYFSLSIAEPVTVSEFIDVDISAFTDVFPAVADSITVVDEATVRLSVYISVHDTVRLPGQFIQPNVFDNVAVEDVPFVSISMTGTLLINESDLIVLQDTVQHLPIVEGDAVALTEFQDFTLNLNANVNDTVTVAEATGRNMHIPPVVFDTVTVAEGVTAGPDKLVPSVFDTVVTTDPATVVTVSGPSADLLISAADVVTVEEAIFGVGPSLNIDTFDNVTVATPQPVASTRFNGVDTYLDRLSDLLGNADSKQFTFSVWMKPADLTAGEMYRSNFNHISWGGNFAFQFSNSSSSQVFAMNMSSGIPVAGVWYNFLVSADLETGVAHFYRNDVDVTNLISSINDFVDWTQIRHTIGAIPATPFTNFQNADVTELYFNNAEYVDLSIEANRRKFISAGGSPIPLGSDGSSPTGSQPIIYMTGDTTEFSTNKGYGGNFTPNGSFTDGDTLDMESSGDVATVNVKLMPFVSDVITATESAGFIGPLVSSFDAVTVTDVGTVNVPLTARPAESVGVTEFVDLRMSMRISRFDNIVAADSTAMVFVTTSDLQISVHDDVTTVEAPALQLNPLLISRSDFVRLDEFVQITGGILPWVPEEPEVSVWAEEPAPPDGWVAETPKTDPWGPET